jgi:hypothetical protein
MTQIVLSKSRDGINKVQNYAAHTPQVRNTKTKRMMKRNTRNAMIMICPFKLAFFMTIATLFWEQQMGRRFRLLESLIKRSQANHCGLMNDIWMLPIYMMG